MFSNSWEKGRKTGKSNSLWINILNSFDPKTQTGCNHASAFSAARSYPVVFLDLPVTGGSTQLLPMGTVGKLEKAGKHPPVLLSVWKDGILEINSVRQEVIVFIHPKGGHKNNGDVNWAAEEGPASIRSHRSLSQRGLPPTPPPVSPMALTAGVTPGMTSTIGIFKNMSLAKVKETVCVCVSICPFVPPPCPPDPYRPSF